MSIDITGIVLIPGNTGMNYPGNGSHFDEFGKLLECCCDECDYLLCCLESHLLTDCMDCENKNCPRFIK